MADLEQQTDLPPVVTDATPPVPADVFPPDFTPLIAAPLSAHEQLLADGFSRGQIEGYRLGVADMQRRASEAASRGYYDGRAAHELGEVGRTAKHGRIMWICGIITGFAVADVLAERKRKTAEIEGGDDDLSDV